MKLRALDPNTSCTINGKIYVPDADGLIDVPDEDVAVFESHGFTREIVPVVKEPLPVFVVPEPPPKPITPPVTPSVVSKKGR